MKTRILLSTLTILLGLHITHAQYLVSATEIANRTATQVQTLLNNEGFNTYQMNLNGVISYKITYNTIDVFGDPTIASGALMVPQVDCDTLPLVSYQHGTRFNKQDVPSNNMDPQFGLVYSGNAYITTLPDYLGMGINPGIHPYVHWESEATASMDLIRAAREFLIDSLQIWDNNQLFLTGYSQGGHSTMAIHKYITNNNLQGEFNVVSSSPMSGPYAMSLDQYDLIINEDSTYAVPYYLPYAFASYQLVYENLYTNYNEYYDSPYDTQIANWINFGANPLTLPNNLYVFIQDSVLDNMQNNPSHPIRVDLRDNDLHNWLPLEPVRMLYCSMDVWVAPQNSITALDTMNALGATDVKSIDVYPDGDHTTCKVPALTYSLEWFDSLNAGCQMVTPYCMPNGATFSTQEQIDNFQTNYPYCLEIGGDVVISGSDIMNLDSLIGLKVINGDLEIHSNELLENLSGLDSLRSINGNFKAYLNDKLTDFTGLENLSAIDGNLVISYNPLLNSLTGLDSIAPGSINNVTIVYNDNLSYCEVESICEHIGASEGNVTIHDNAQGCNSQQEVEEICWVSVNEYSLSDNLKNHPNPFSTSTTIKYELSQSETIRITIYSHMGGQVEVIEQHQQKGFIEIVWNPENLPNGIYYFRLQAGEKIRQGKMVLMR